MVCPCIKSGYSYLEIVSLLSYHDNYHDDSSRFIPTNSFFTIVYIVFFIKKISENSSEMTNFAKELYEMVIQIMI